MRAALGALLLAFTLTACGGDDGGSSPSPSPPGQDPCAGQRQEAFEAQAPADGSAAAAKRGALDPSPRLRVLESLWIHRAGGRTPPLDLDPRARRGHFDRCRRHRRAPRRGGPHRSGEQLRSEGPRPPFHAQFPGRLRRPPGRRRRSGPPSATGSPSQTTTACGRTCPFPFRSTRGASGPPSSTPTATSRFARATARARTAASAAC